MATKRIYGIRAIIEAIQSDTEIEKIYVLKGLKNDLSKELLTLCDKLHVPMVRVPKEKMARLGDKNHQGALAFVSKVPFYNFEEEIIRGIESGEKLLVLCLDSVTDVRNFGAICRSAECFGANLVVVPAKGSAAVNEDAIKTSAGALFKIKLARASNLRSALEFMRDSGLQIVACTEKGDTNYAEVDWSLPSVVLMGSEDTGIHPQNLRLASVHASIPMKGEIASLNVSVATGIMLAAASA
jgi:23S rRNA (guanosine2251-2'-O)-methyltransferase